MTKREKVILTIGAIFWLCAISYLFNKRLNY